MPKKIKPNPTLDRKTWDRVWIRYDKWTKKNIKKLWIAAIVSHNSRKSIKRIVNAELKKVSKDV